MDFRELLDALAADSGMTEAVAYEEDTCHLDIDGRDIGFRNVPEAGRLVIWTAIAPLPPESDKAFLVQLLRANFMSQGMPDGALSLSDDDVIYAHCALKLPVYDKDEFYDLLLRFLAVAEEWCKMIGLAGRARGLMKTVRPDEPQLPFGQVRIDG